MKADKDFIKLVWDTHWQAGLLWRECAKAAPMGIKDSETLQLTLQWISDCALFAETLRDRVEAAGWKVNKDGSLSEDLGLILPPGIEGGQS